MCETVSWKRATRPPVPTRRTARIAARVAWSAGAAGPQKRRPRTCGGFAGVARGVVGVVGVVVAPGVLDEEGTGIAPPVSPALVTTNVTARINAPRAAMIAGRGSSIRGALGTVGIERRLLLRIRHVGQDALV